MKQHRRRRRRRFELAQRRPSSLCNTVVRAEEDPLKKWIKKASKREREKNRSQVGKQEKQNKFATRTHKSLFLNFNIFFYNVQLSIMMFFGLKLGRLNEWEFLARCLALACRLRFFNEFRDDGYEKLEEASVSVDKEECLMRQGIWWRIFGAVQNSMEFLFPLWRRFSRPPKIRRTHARRLRRELQAKTLKAFRGISFPECERTTTKSADKVEKKRPWRRII